MKGPRKPCGPCGLCGARKSPSFRNNVLKGGVICNACYCFLNRQSKLERGAKAASSPRNLELCILRFGSKKKHKPAHTKTSGGSPGPLSATEEAEHMQESVEEAEDGEEVEEGEDGGEVLPPQQQQRRQQRRQLAALLAPPPPSPPSPQSLQSSQQWPLPPQQQSPLQQQSSRPQQLPPQQQSSRQQRQRLQQQQQEQEQEQQHATKEPQMQTAEPCKAAMTSRTVTTSEPAGQPSLAALREAAWQTADNLEQATLVVQTAWAPHLIPAMQRHANQQLPGIKPQLLGVTPSVWVLLPGNPRRPHPAGALLLSVHLPPQGLNREAQELLLATGTGLEQSLRMLVYNSESGVLLERKDFVLREDQSTYQHPRFGVPAWDSGDEWTLLFPHVSSETHQLDLFTCIIRLYGSMRTSTLTSSLLLPSPFASASGWAALSNASIDSRWQLLPQQQALAPEQLANSFGSSSNMHVLLAAQQGAVPVGSQPLGPRSPQPSWTASGLASGEPCNSTQLGWSWQPVRPAVRVAPHARSPKSPRLDSPFSASWDPEPGFASLRLGSPRAAAATACEPRTPCTPIGSAAATAGMASTPVAAAPMPAPAKSAAMPAADMSDPEPAAEEDMLDLLSCGDDVESIFTALGCTTLAAQAAASRHTPPPVWPPFYPGGP